MLIAATTIPARPMTNEAGLLPILSIAWSLEARLRYRLILPKFACFGVLQDNSNLLLGSYQSALNEGVSRASRSNFAIVGYHFLVRLRRRRRGIDACTCASSNSDTNTNTNTNTYSSTTASARATTCTSAAGSAPTAPTAPTAPNKC